MPAFLVRMITAAAAAAAAVAARRAVELGWKLATGDEPPTPGEVTGDTELRELVLWSALLAAAVVLARRVITARTEALLGVDTERA